MSKGLKQRFDEFFKFIDAPKCYKCKSIGTYRVRVPYAIKILCDKCYNEEEIIDNLKEERGDIVKIKELDV